MNRTCAIDGCPYAGLGADGKCLRHTDDDAAAPVCTVAGCKRPHQSRGLCPKHYEQARAAGELARHLPIGIGAHNVGRGQFATPGTHDERCRCRACAPQPACGRCFLRGPHVCLDGIEAFATMRPITGGRPT